MKRYLIIMLCGISVFMSGCQEQELNPLDVVSNALTIEEIVEADMIFSPEKIDGKINFYYLSGKPTPYLDFNQFISKFPKFLGDNLKLERDESSVSLTYKYQDGTVIYTDEIAIDFENETLYFTRPFLAMGIEVEKPTPVTISLQDYEIDLYVDDEIKLMPVYLYSLLLGQYSGDLMLHNKNELYVTNTFNRTFNDLVDQFRTTPGELRLTLDEVLINESFNYLNLLMDHIYGLKGYQNMDSYKELIDQYRNDETNNWNYYERLLHFLMDLNDGHTAMIAPSNLGIYLDNAVLKEIEEDNEYLSKVRGGYTRNMCEERASDEVIQTYRDDVIYMDYRSFDTRDEAQYKKVLDEMENKTIILDIRCNGGGFATTSMKDLLDYLSNDPVTIYFGDINNGRYEITTNERESKNDYVLLTSPYSFSSANTFTSAFKEWNLGTIVGETTGGGTATVAPYVLPDGTIIYLSNSILMINSKGELIEEGIQPDIELIFTPDMDLKVTLLDMIDTKLAK
ncbi:MAG: S41 family peptidase [Turicibacter sp.]